MNNELRWDPLRLFLAVARAGSVAAAARQLGLSHATVIRNVAQLERRLGLRLFDHVRSGYRLTADGEEVLTDVAAMAEHAEALLRRATGRDPVPQGRLKLVTTDASLFDPMPLLRRFLEAQPRIELAVEDAPDGAEARLAGLHADAAIVVTNAPAEDLVGRQLTRLRLGWYASDAYLRRFAAQPPAPDDCHWIVWTLGASAELDENWQRTALRRLTGRPQVVLQARAHADAVAAVRAGVGVALLGEAAGEGLTRLPFAEPPGLLGVWLLTHPDLRRAGRVRALFDFVAVGAASGRE
ncbi:MAG TPA: LysR family transcriptional regulator [Pseudomonadales bacterium]